LLPKILVTPKVAPNAALSDFYTQKKHIGIGLLMIPIPSPLWGGLGRGLATKQSFKKALPNPEGFFILTKRHYFHILIVAFPPNAV
jgi:hypothetical protein